MGVGLLGVLVSAILHLGYFLLLQRGYAVGDMSVLSPLACVLVLFAMRLAPMSLVAPARELSVVVASLLAWRVLGEAQPVRRLTGAPWS